MSELETVDHWFSLGFYLNIPMVELERLKLTHGYRKEGVREMLQAWLITGEASYSTLVDALVGIGMLSLARKIAVKYGKQLWVFNTAKRNNQLTFVWILCSQES